MAKQLTLAAALLCLLTCLVVPVLFFTGQVGRPAFETVFLIASVGWFAFATWWAQWAEPEAYFEG